MKKAARRGQQLKVESFVDLVWAVPLHRQSKIEPNGRVMHRLKGLPQAGRRIVLLRSYVGGDVPDMLAI
jgi:hypothetical protein